MLHKKRALSVTVLSFTLVFSLIGCGLFLSETTGNSTAREESETASVTGETEALPDGSGDNGSEETTIPIPVPTDTGISTDPENPSETQLPPIDVPSWDASLSETSVPSDAFNLTVDPSGNWERWPSVLTTPVEMSVDLSAYAGRIKDESALNGITVILDPGHGGRDPGAIAVHEGMTIYEKDINLAVAQIARLELEALGATVIMTREDDSWVSLYQRVGMAGIETLNIWEHELQQAGLDAGWLDGLRPEMQKMIDINEDTVESDGRGIAQGIGVRPQLRTLLDAQAQTDQLIFLSIHANSTDNATLETHGMQLYISTNQVVYESELGMMMLDPGDSEILPINPNYTAYNDIARLHMGNSIYAGVTDLIPELRQGDISVFAGNFAFLREMNITSVLIEMGFMSNASDLSILLDPGHQADIAYGIADGVWRFYSQQP